MEVSNKFCWTPPFFIKLYNKSYFEAARST